MAVMGLNFARFCHQSFGAEQYAAIHTYGAIQSTNEQMKERKTNERKTGKQKMNERTKNERTNEWYCTAMFGILSPQHSLHCLLFSANNAIAIDALANFTITIRIGYIFINKNLASGDNARFTIYFSKLSSDILLLETPCPLLRNVFYPI